MLGSLSAAAAAAEEEEDAILLLQTRVLRVSVSGLLY